MNRKFSGWTRSWTSFKEVARHLTAATKENHEEHQGSRWCGRDSNFVDCVWNVMAHAQKPDFVFRRNGRVHLNRRGRQFSRLLAAELCASAVVMLDTSCSEVAWRVLASHSIRQFPLHFPSLASPCAIMFQLESTFRMLDVSCWVYRVCCDLKVVMWGQKERSNVWPDIHGLTVSAEYGLL